MQISDILYIRTTRDLQQQLQDMKRWKKFQEAGMSNHANLFFSLSQLLNRQGLVLYLSYEHTFTQDLYILHMNIKNIRSITTVYSNAHAKYTQ